MKKIRSILSLLLCLLLGSGCAASPARAAQKALKNTLDLSSMALRMELQLNASKDGEQRSLPFSANIWLQRDGEQAWRMNATSTLTKGESVSRAEVYQTGAWFYVTTNNTSYKSNTPFLIEQYGYTVAVDALLREYPQTVWENAQIDGEKVVFDLDAATLLTLYAPLTDDMWQALPVFTDFTADAAYTLVNGVLSMTVDEGYITDCTLTLELQGSGIILSATLSLRLSSPGSDVAVSPPTGYQYFPEYSIS